MKLKLISSLVPTCELCNRLTAGEFEESALVWFRDPNGVPAVLPRDGAQYEILYGEGGSLLPAPTLEEKAEAMEGAK